APDLSWFAALRIAQGLCMATAFSLTLAHLGESGLTPREATAAFAAYVTGNVASNLIGRLASSGLADAFGLHGNFYAFALLNLGGAVLAALLIPAGAATAVHQQEQGIRERLEAVLAARRLLAIFLIGFCILFAFIGTFTYVGFVLVAPPLALPAMALGLVYFVFAPSIITTPLASEVTKRFGRRRTLAGSLLLALLALPLLVTGNLPLVLAGMTLVAVGTFLAQATATAMVSRVPGVDRGAASGFYLASYFSGGLVGSAIIGRIFDAFGWPSAVAGIGAALALAAAVATRLRPQAEE
ncbi:MAG: MFS transporter, partial [Beijerinckiaceae bacterium]